MRYKISEVSKMTDIPVVTIRYFEEQGIVSPVRKGSYRYFSEQDIYNLCEYRKMRSYGMKLEEIKEFFQIQDMKTYASAFERLEEQYKKQADRYRILAECTSKSVRTIQEAERNIGQFIDTQISEKYYLDFYYGEEAVGPRDLWQEWVHEYYPFVEYLALIDEKTTWVNAIDAHIVEELRIPINGRVGKIEAQRAIYTVVREVGDQFYDPKQLPDIENYLKEHHLKRAGAIVGKLIAGGKSDDLFDEREGNQTYRHIGYWIPVKNM